jgi:Arylsulfotransferase (ASST)
VGVGLGGDLHEFHITADNTALITVYHNHESDCTDLGFGSACWINDSLFQEIDIETGDLIFQWQASDHVRMSDSTVTPKGKDGQTEDSAFDFFHINSVDKDDQGNYIISSRYMNAVMCISPTGETLWSLGGVNNSFQDLSDGDATNFAKQHHANWNANSTLSLFDNHGDDVFRPRGEFSRGMKISLDLEEMTATLVESYVHPEEILAVSQGSMQILDNGNAFVGFGNSPAYTEFSADGEVLCDGHFGPSLIFEILDLGLVKSYRAFKSQWVGRPNAPPDIKVKGGRVYVSWNGATEVTSWRLQGAEDVSAVEEDFVTIQELEKDGFETSFALDQVSEASIRIVALDAKTSVLASTAVVSAASSEPVSDLRPALEPTVKSP